MRHFPLAAGRVVCLPAIIGNNTLDRHLGLARMKIDSFSFKPLFHIRAEIKKSYKSIKKCAA